jgi:multidrug efflux pump subunit AcrA (membrane-fusion protein)
MDEASPRFRQNLIASAAEADGVAVVDVSDPDTGNNFRFYDFEYQLALQLNGQPIGEVTAWASATYGVDLTPDGIGEFAGRLAELGFLEPRSDDDDAPPEPANVSMDTPAPAMSAQTPPPEAAGAAPAEALDSAEAEWMSVEASKTATFVPDASMLEGPAELTPVVPDLPELSASEPTPVPEPTPIPVPGPPAPAARVEAPLPPTPPPLVFAPPPKKEIERSVAVTRPVDAPTIPALPSNMTLDAIRRDEASKRDAALGSPKWALDLDGTFGSSPGMTPSKKKPPSTAPEDRTPSPVTPPPIPSLEPRWSEPAPRATEAPVGLPERRQPPPPEAVVMTDFSVDGRAAAEGAMKQKKSARVAMGLLVVLAVAVIGYFVWRSQAPATPQAVRVKVFSPKPSAVYRWFTHRGKIVDYDVKTLAFESKGRIAELLPPGTEFAAGDILGRLQGAAAIESLLTHHRTRLAYYRQMRESMQAAGNAPEVRQAEIKLADKQRSIDETLASLGPLVIRAAEPGQLSETLAKIGTLVKGGVPIVRVKGRLLHGEIEIDAGERASLAKLSFCRVEVAGPGPRRFVDCTLPKTLPADAGKLRVGLPGDLGLVSGQSLRLARQRYDAVFPVPATAVSVSGDVGSIWIAGRAGVAEQRSVVVAELGDEALVSDGLRIDDQVIIDAPPNIRAGLRVMASR